MECAWGTKTFLRAMPEVFAPPPAIIGGFMAQEAEAVLFKLNPVAAGVMKERGLFLTEPPRKAQAARLASAALQAARMPVGFAAPHVL